MAPDVRHILQDCVFTWDASKAAANVRKHGVRFEEACEVFFDPLYEMEEDPSSKGDQRWRIVGFTGADQLLVVVATEPASAWPIILARRVGSGERRKHEKADDTH